MLILGSMACSTSEQLNKLGLTMVSLMAPCGVLARRGGGGVPAPSRRLRSCASRALRSSSACRQVGQVRAACVYARPMQATAQVLRASVQWDASRRSLPPPPTCLAARSSVVSRASSLDRLASHSARLEVER